VEYDPNFARIYLREKMLMLDILREGDKTLHDVATTICKAGLGSFQKCEYTAKSAAASAGEFLL
jgi:hypothetical protein